MENGKLTSIRIIAIPAKMLDSLTKIRKTRKDAGYTVERAVTQRHVCPGVKSHRAHKETYVNGKFCGRNGSK